MTSAAVSVDPVRPAYVPSSPGACESSHVAPMSGAMPMVTSGIANAVRSVTTRTEPWAEMPTPPPMVMPSMIAT